MGSSKILEVCSSILSLPITLDGETVKTYGFASMPNSFTTAHLPARFISPVNRYVQGFGQSDSNFNAGYGSVVNKMSWNLVEYFLYEPVSQNIGLKTNVEPLVTFCAKYLEGISSATFQMPTNTWYDNVLLRPDIIEFPLASGSFYFGVVVLITIQEKIP